MRLHTISDIDNVVSFFVAENEQTNANNEHSDIGNIGNYINPSKRVLFKADGSNSPRFVPG